MLLNLIFPPKPDANEYAAYVARLVLGVGLLCLLWSGYQLALWARSYTFTEVTGQVEQAEQDLFSQGMSGSYVSYTVDGQQYLTNRLAYGGRPFTAVKLQGETPVYYDPANPANAVIWRRPNEAVVIAFIIGLAAPFLARWIWVEHA